LVKSRQAEAGNYPFTTIDKNFGMVKVPDDRLEKIAEILKISKKIPATIKFIDIAGLVKNAHKGEGLGNQFLSYIRETDLICLVLRCFEDPNVAHVLGKINPKEDLEIVKTELELADLEKTKDKKPKIKNTNGKINPTGVSGVKKFKDIPMIYVANVAEIDAAKSPEEIINKYSLNSLIPNPASLIVVSAKTEQDLTDLSENEQKEYLKTLGLKKSGLDKLVRVAYQTLNLITFYTLKSDQVQAWPIPLGTKAPQAGGKIHTDFEKGFIAAEVIGYEDFITTTAWSDAQRKGLIRKEGRDYEIKDGDIVNFLFNA